MLSYKKGNHILLHNILSHEFIILKAYHDSSCFGWTSAKHHNVVIMWLLQTVPHKLMDPYPLAI